MPPFATAGPALTPCITSTVTSLHMHARPRSHVPRGGAGNPQPCATSACMRLWRVARAPCRSTSLQVLILKEACDVRLVPLSHDSAKAPALAHGAQAMDSAVVCPQIPAGRKLTFTWKIDNFLAFKEILETRKIFSKFFSVGGCDLRIGVYESFDTLCIYLESEAQSAGDPQDGSFWVRYRIAAVSQKKPELTEWKESSICTRAWNNSVLQFIKVPDMLNRCVAPRKQVACHVAAAVGRLSDVVEGGWWGGGKGPGRRVGGAAVMRRECAGEKDAVDGCGVRAVRRGTLSRTVLC